MLEVCLNNIWVVIPVYQLWTTPLNYSTFIYSIFPIFELPSNLNSSSTVLWKQCTSSVETKIYRPLLKRKDSKFWSFDVVWCDVMWCNGNHLHASSDTILVWYCIIHGLNYEIHAHSHTHTHMHRGRKKWPIMALSSTAGYESMICIDFLLL